MKKRTMNRLVLLLTATLFTVASLNVVAQERKAGVIDKTGNFVVFPQYDKIFGFHEGVSVVEINGNRGVIDKNGKVIVPPQKYEYISNRYYEGLVVVDKDGKSGVVDKNGKEIVPLFYEDIWDFHEGLAAVKIRGKYGFIDKTGKEVIPPRYDQIWDFQEGLAKVRINEKWGFIDKTGKEVVPPKYTNVRNFKNGYAAVAREAGSWNLTRWGFIDKTGREVIPPRYDDVGDFNDGIAEVSKVGLLISPDCWIDRTGKEITPMNEYHYLGHFQEGLASVGLIYEEAKNVYEFAKYKYGFIDKSGKEVIKPRFDEVDYRSFSDGFAKVRIGGKWGVINKTGEEIVKPRFDDIYSYHGCDYDDGFIIDWKEFIFIDGLAVVSIEGKCGFIDKTGNEAIPLRYERARPFCEGLAIVEVKTDDITLFEKKNNIIQATWNECNQQLKDCPYNIENLRLEPVSLQKYFLDPRIETITDSIVAELKQKTKDKQNVCYKRLKSNQPEKFAGIYLQLHPEARPILDNLKLECRCGGYSEGQLVVWIADNNIPECTCRNDYWNQYGTLFSSRVEFDSTYNMSEQGFLDDVKLRQSLKIDIQEIASMLAGLKSAKFKDGLTGKKEDIVHILQRVQYHKGKYYYDEVLEMMFIADVAMMKEWEKNGQLFSSKNEFYEAYVSGDYKNVLKEKKSK